MGDQSGFLVFLRDVPRLPFNRFLRFFRSSFIVHFLCLFTGKSLLVPATMKFHFGLLSFVTVVLIIGSVSQLALLRQLEDSQGIPFLRNDTEAEILRLGYIKPEVLSWSPRIILLRNFLSMEECEYLKALGYPHLQNAKTVDERTGKSIISNLRTSSGMFLNSEDRKHPMVQAIEKRISIHAQVPIENGEPIQILRYEKNQFHKLHTDYFIDTHNVKDGGQRIATMLMYIGDNAEGGETYFPMGGSGETNCGGKIVKGLSVKPIKGNAVLFWSLGLSGQSDPYSVHESCEVLSGAKWSAVKWMREETFPFP